MNTTAPHIKTMAGLLVLGSTFIAAPPALAKKRSAATYMTTVKVAMTERWDFRELTTHSDPDGTNSREEKGAGTASANLRTRRPFPLMAIRGPKGKPPILNHGSDGIPMTGGWLRSGSLTTDYEGPWAPANPDRTEPTADCGMIDVKPFATVGWVYGEKGKLQLFAEPEPLREECPDGPPRGLRWPDGDSPGLSDVIASVGKHKFLKTKQFTVRGTRTWTGTVDPVNRSSSSGSHQVGGSKTVTWQWEATFRMKTKKRKRK